MVPVRSSTAATSEWNLGSFNKQLTRRLAPHPVRVVMLSSVVMLSPRTWEAQDNPHSMAWLLHPQTDGLEPEQYICSRNQQQNDKTSQIVFEVCVRSPCFSFSCRCVVLPRTRCSPGSLPLRMAREEPSASPACFRVRS